MRCFNYFLRLMRQTFESHLRVLGLVIFIICWLSANHYRPWTSFHSETLSFLALFILFLSSLIKATSIHIPLFLNWIFCILLSLWLQYSFGLIPYAGDALLITVYLTGFLMSVVFGYRLMAHDETKQSNLIVSLAHSIWVAAVISAGLGLIQWLNLADSLGIYVVQTDIGTRAAGNLAQPNQLATFLLMGMIALVYLFECKIIGEVGLAIAVTFMTIVLVLTQSRAGMVSVLVVGAFLYWKHRPGNLRLPKQAVLWWIGSFAMATLALPCVSKWLMMSDSRSFTETGSINERWLIWKQVAYAISQAPWFGYGWNQTPTANAVGALVFPGSTTYTNAHNIVLDLMVWCGIPIGLLLTGVMVYWGISRMRAVQKPGAVLAMAALLPIAVHSMLEFPFAYAYFLISAGFFIGIVEAAHVPAKAVTVRTRWLWIVLGVWASLGGYMTYEYLLIEEDFRIVRFENMHVGATPANYEVPHVWMLSHMAAMLQAARQIPKPDMPKTDLENLRKVSDRFAYGAIRFKYAQALGLNGDPAGATKQMQIIHGMYGDFFYRACKDELTRLATDKYPQLAQIALPG